MSPHNRYQRVGLANVPPQLVMRTKPPEIKSKAFLNVKGRDPIPAVDVLADKGERGANLYLIFSRTENPITLENNEVEVVVKLGTVDIKRRFRLKDMVFDGKLEL